MGNGLECARSVVQHGPAVGQRQVQRIQVVQATPESALHVSLWNVVTTEFDAQRHAVHRQLCAGQRDIEDLNAVALSFAAVQKQGKGSAGQGGLKRKAHLGCGKPMQAFEHDAACFERHGFRRIGRQPHRNLIRVDKLQNAQCLLEQVGRGRRFACAIGAGNDHHRGLLFECAGTHGCYFPQLLLSCKSWYALATARRALTINSSIGIVLFMRGATRPAAKQNRLLRWIDLRHAGDKSLGGSDRIGREVRGSHLAE
ncbi:hypothetical protein GALL_540990 [mine drainage metagenome]|uniref:Uncharacterized protein n=1 Tax=mine drainage metagenome TaxID=410659 RepID=A0A1J5NZT5_9ZZZZ